MSRIDETIQAKLEKRALLEQMGIDVHPPAFDKKNSIADCRNSLNKLVQTAGRVMACRTHGKVIFFDVHDPSGQIQVMIRQQEVGDKQFAITKLVDTSDFIGVTGKVTTTKTGEITILAQTVVCLGKSLRPLPTEWNAAENKEIRFRRRYVDMLVNENTRRVLDARWKILKEIRKFLGDRKDFVEVETPILQGLYGGTNAKPFTTHMNALDSDFYLRLAPELYLKRLIVGGYEKIFEIARNFRNEGIDQTHQPEFTMIEWYEAYADYQKMMQTAEELVKHLVYELYGGTQIEVGDKKIDVGGIWPQLTMIETLSKYADIDFNAASDQTLKQLLLDHEIKIIGEFSRGKALFALFDNLVTGKLIDPIWIIDYPRDVSPLAKKHRHNPELAERFEGYIGGKELADGWSEITDSKDQRQIFENEQKRMRAGDDEAHPLDEDFLEAMEYGMPPLGGIGIGIDRLVMFLTNTWSIKEVIAFPTLKPNLPKVGLPKISPIHQEKPNTIPKKEPLNMPTRENTDQLLRAYIKNDALIHHCQMVAEAMQAYAKKLGEDEELWYQVGLLHDVDYEMFPDEHPHKAINELLADYPQTVKDAIAAHAPDLTGRQPQTLMEKYLFACDEISGLMHAASLMRPGGFTDMQPKSVKKKIKDKSFAAKVNRDDIKKGFTLIETEPDNHITFLIEVFKNKPAAK